MAVAVVFIPGIFGFGTFGHTDGEHITYFYRVEQALLRAKPSLEGKFVFTEPPPTASLASRVASLHARLAALGSEEIYLVGHSAGGVDARLFANSRYQAEGVPTVSEREPLIKKIAGIVTLATPFFGTPLADRLRRVAGLVLPELYQASIAASQVDLSDLGTVMMFLSEAVRRLGGPASPNQVVYEMLAHHVDRQTAEDIGRFMKQVSSHHELVDDLTVANMARLNRTIAGGDSVPISSFVTAAPPPSLGRPALLEAPLRRLLYAAMYQLTRSEPLDGQSLPTGPWIEPRVGAELLEGSNDAVVPTASQSLDGTAAGLVWGDHADVIGHFDSPGNEGATFLKSGAGFNNARFDALWAAVATHL